MTLRVMIFKKFSRRVFWALFHPFSWLRFHQAYVCHLILCFIFIVLFFACPLAFLHSSYFLPSAGNSFNWVFYLSVLSPHSSVLGNSFFCSALKWICVFIIAVDCNIWKELRKNISPPTLATGNAESWPPIICIWCEFCQREKGHWVSLPDWEKEESRSSQKCFVVRSIQPMRAKYFLNKEV